MIVNIRGTHGSGKSTVVRDILDRYLPRTPIPGDRPNKPDGYMIHDTPYGSIYIVGSYETECGGCDGIQPYAKIWPRVITYAEIGDHVLFEGALVSNSYGNIGRESEPFDSLYNFTFAFLDTPLQTCIDRILKRRQERGNTKPFDPNKSVVRIYNSCNRVLEKVQHEFHRNYVILDHQRAVPQVLGMLWKDHHASQP